MTERPIRDLVRQARGDDRLATVPNACSLIRILLVPLIVYFIMHTTAVATYYALALMAAAYLLDMFDGYYARSRGQETRLGRVLDPLADKLLTNTVIISMILFRSFPVWFAALVLFRDITYFIFGYTLLRGKDMVLKASRWGKVTAFFVGLTVFAYVAFGSEPSAMAYLYVLKGICISLIIGSGINYLNGYIGLIHNGTNGKPNGGAV